eukprot:CAMPEP_0113636460 /NCGR_PEP_ID=MMETSP0017_2-20120614/19036_1 /TAXON_ID=2856 /ORGANISM="Cylindrotheca closterium" /LENGTH=579 /DNA_ID=CAMNT_0000547345 /DNA_START=82 /DNA_END=1821 /DNA_ORIENTATION=- /assembly_acc=CAM_ASM_000147
MKLQSYILLSLTLERGCAFMQNAQTSHRVIASGTPSKTTLFADLLAEEGSWQAYLDEESTGLIYYFDTATGESLWEPPTDTFPEVKLPRKKQRLADDLRREYRQSLGLDGDGVDDSNWFSGLFASGSQESVVESEPEAAVEEVAEEVVEEESTPSWPFSGITSSLQQEDEEIVAEVEEPKEAESPMAKPWFGNIGAKKETPVEEEATTEAEPKSGFLSGLNIGAKKEAPVEEEATEVEPKSGFLGGLFGNMSPAKAEVQEEVKEEPKPVEKKEVKPKLIKTNLQVSAADDKIKAKKTVEPPAPKKKKDPKIGGNVKRAIAVNTRSPKKGEVTMEPIKIEVASNIIPHPAKILWGGEDAVFTKGRSFGVFDGVSGADKKDGVALYSRTLANEMKKRVGTEGLNVQEMTKYLTESADIADSQATGASTAVVASIGENGFLQALNVGDSCCMVIRDGMIAAKTRDISHYWECPYQLSSDSPDRPKDGTKLNVELTTGDIVLMGSDGIFDNVNDDLILDTIDGSSTKAGQIAKQICNVARKQSVSKEASTPYAQQAKKRGLPEYQFGVGGKVDDIGCVVVVCK